MKYLRKISALVLSTLILISSPINAAFEYKNLNKFKKPILISLGAIASVVTGGVVTAPIINFLKRDDDKLLEAMLVGKNWCDSERARNIWAYFLNERAYHVYYLDSIFLFASGLSIDCDIPGIPKNKYAENYNDEGILIINVKNAEEIENDIELMFKWWSEKIRKENYTDENYMSKDDLEFLTYVFRKFRGLKNKIEAKGYKYDGD